VTAARPVVAADRKVFMTPMEDGLRVAGTVEFGGLDAGSDTKARGISGARPVAGVSARANSGRLVVLDGTPSVLPDSLPVMGQAAIAACGSISATAISG
jgi:D-amino-acid dehydrogenase